MPVHKAPGGWMIGSGKAVYRSKKLAEKAYKAYLAKKHSGKDKQR